MDGFSIGDNVSTSLGVMKIEKIQVGSTGQVLLGFVNHQPVAWKIYRSDLKESTRQGIRNWLLLGNSRYIARCYTFDEMQGNPAIFIEWVVDKERQSHNLQTLIARGLLPLQDSLQYIIDISRALQYADTQLPGFVHGDISPRNILLARTVSAKLTDFDTSITNTFKDPKTGANREFTPLYSAPERTHVGEFDTRADIYSLGAILYHCLVGQTIVPGAKESFRALSDNLPKAISNIIDRCTQGNPDARYTSVRELLEELTKAYRTLFQVAPPKALPADKDNWMFVCVRAAGLYNLGYGKLAISKFSEAIETSTGISDAIRASIYNDRGVANSESHLFDDAIADFTKAIQFSKGTTPHPWIGRSNTYLEMKWFKEALSDADQAINLAPDDAMAHNNRAWALLGLNRILEAQTDARKALELDPKNERIHNTIAAVKLGFGYIGLAQPDLKTSFELNPSYAPTNINQARYDLLVSQDDVKAEKRLKRILRDNPSIPAYYHLFLVYVRRQQLHMADQVAEDAVEHFPAQGIGYLLRWSAKLLLRQETELDFEQAQAILPDYAEYIQQLANDFISIGHPERALTLLLGYNTTHPQESSETYLLLASAYKAMKQVQAAISAYNRAVELAPEKLEYLVERASYYGELTLYKEALEDLSAVIQSNPQLSIAYNNRGYVYEKLEQYSQSLQDYDSADSQAGRTDLLRLTILVNRARVLLKLGLMPLAKRDFEELTVLLPTDPNIYANIATLLFEEEFYHAARPYLEKAQELGLSSDPEHYQIYIDALRDPVRKQREDFRIAYEAFLNAQSYGEMKRIVAENPILSTHDAVATLREKVAKDESGYLAVRFGWLESAITL